MAVTFDKLLGKLLLHSHTVELDTRYLKLSGDTMTGDLNLQDNVNLYFDTAKTYSIKYSPPHTDLLWGSEYFTAIGQLWILANAGADGLGNWEPSIHFNTTGVLELINVSQGDAGNKYLKIDFTDGVYIDTGGTNAILKADNLATANRTFQFPNASGTLAILELAQTFTAGQTIEPDVDVLTALVVNDTDSNNVFTVDTINNRTFTPKLVGGTGVTSVLSLQGTSGNGTLTSPAIQLLVGNNGDTTALTILNNGNVGIGKTNPSEKLEISGKVKIGSQVTAYTLANLAGGYIEFVDGQLGLGTAKIGGMNGYIDVIQTHSLYGFIIHKSSAWGGQGLIGANNNFTISTGVTTQDIVFNGGNFQAATELMRIKGTGNVGIGVTDPDTRLEIFNGGNQLKLSFDATDNAIFAVDTNGDLTIIPSGSNFIIPDAKNIALNTTTGSKLGTATGQKLGFWGITPVVQQVLATGGGATVDNVISLLQTLGICKQA